MRKTLLNLYPNESVRVSVSDPDLLPPEEPAEMPRAPIRFRLVLFGLVTFVIAGASMWFLSNPVGKIRDPRLGEQYNGVPLTAIGSPAENQSELLIGSMGKGLRVYDVSRHFFGPDITVASTEGTMLSNFVADLDVANGEQGLGALIPANNEQATVTGLQPFYNLSGSPRFWTKPLIDLRVFPGLSDQTASCAGSTSDGTRLIVGTRGHGIGVYTIAHHSWSHVLTEEQGLPSNTIHDLAVIDSPIETNPSWLYMATDRGIAGGHLSQDGLFDQKIVYTSENGIAGDDVRELQVKGQQIWYRTADSGFGRIGVAEDGTPNGIAPEILITESRIHGLSDKLLRNPARSPAGPVTWFSASIDGKTHIGRYREFPHDLVGTAVPDEFKSLSEGSAATDWETGSTALFGTEDGAWHIFDQGSGQLTVSYAGPVGLAVHETVLCRRPVETPDAPLAAVMKVESVEKIPFLLRAQVESEMGWDWTTLTGPGRFPGLASLKDITSIVEVDGLVLFGTSGNGIGSWKRSTMEVIRHGHSSGSTPLTLRSDSTLDLVNSQGTLVQVTGDYGVDTFPGAAGPAISLVSPSAAGLSPTSIQYAAASGPWLALAESDRLSVYDARTFLWRDLPGVEDIAQIEISGDGIWTRSRAGALQHINLTNPSETWTRLPGSFTSLGTNQDTAVALTETSEESPAAIQVFDGITGETFPGLNPVPAAPGANSCLFAAARGDSLFLAGDDGIHEYDIKLRAWSAHPFPPEMLSPVASARQNDEGFWMLNQAGRCIHFNLATPGFSVIAEDLDSIGFSNDSIMMLRNEASELDRATLVSSPSKSRVIVGRAFRGDLASVKDAIEWKGKLLAITGSSVGLYRWDHHDWETLPQETVSDMRNLISSGDQLWAVSGSLPQGLSSWTGEAFQPVLNGSGEQQSFTRITDGMHSVLQLSQDGKIFKTTAINPTLAKEVFSAPRLPAATTVDPEKAAIVGKQLVIGTGSQLHIYRKNNDGLSEWQSVDGEGPLRRIIQSQDEDLLLEERDSGFWIRRMSGGTNARLEPPPSGNPKARHGAITSRFAAASYEMTGESGLRVRLASPSGEISSDLIGSPLPDGGRTLQVLETSAPAGILRLSDRGQIAWYGIGDHGWSVAIPQSSIREIFPIIGGGFWAWDSENRALKKLDEKGVPKNQDVKDPQLHQVSFFEEGALLHYLDGRLDRMDTVSGETKPILTVDPHRPGSLSPAFIAAAEIPGEDTLVIVDKNGKVNAFDWAAQKWLDSGKLPKIEALFTHNGELYFRDAESRILGPAKRTDITLDTPLPEFKPRQYLNLDNGLSAIGTDGSFHQFDGGWKDAATTKKPFAELGEITEVFESDGLEYFLDEKGGFTARKGAVWFEWEETGAGYRLANDLFAFDGRQLFGPLKPAPDAAGKLQGEPIENPDDIQFESLRKAGEFLFLQSEDGSWYQFDGGNFKKHDKELPEPEQNTGIPGIEGFGQTPELVNWRSTASELEEGTLERRFAENWIPVTIGVNGFNFEKLLAAEIRAGEVWVYTPQGRLTFGRNPAPLDLDPDIVLPGEVVGTPNFDRHKGVPVLHDQSSYWIWADGTGWNPAPPDWLEAFNGKPLLESDVWGWVRESEMERVTFTKTGKKRSGTFSPTRGRFGWDDIREIGQAAGRVFALTESGLFSIHESGMADLPELTGDELGGIEEIEFVDSTGNEPGGLKRGNVITHIFDGTEWKDASEAPETVARIENERVGNDTWRLARDGKTFRSLPQDPSRFTPVSILADGRWDFETVDDLVAIEDRLFLATRAGLISLEGLDMATWWPDTAAEGVNQLYREEGLPVARGQNGNRLRLVGLDWIADGAVEPDLTVVREGSRFRMTIPPSGQPAYEVRRHEGAEFIATTASGGRFAFEHFGALSTRGGNMILATSPEGVVEIDPQGDLRPPALPGDLPLAGATFFEALNPDTGKWETFVDGEGKFFVYRDGWKELDNNQGTSAAGVGKQLMARNHRWTVYQSGSGLNYHLRLDADPSGVYKPVSFDANQRLFDFDQFLSLDLTNETGQAIMIGTSAGVQRLNIGNGLEPEKLWGQSNAEDGTLVDGLAAMPVTEITRCTDGNVYAHQAGGIFTLKADTGRFETAETGKVAAEVLIRAADESGWNVVFTNAGSPDLRWKGQTVLLKPTAEGNSSRFAHNLVHSAAVSGGRLVLGTEGGLVFLNSPDESSLSQFQVVSAPFLEGAQMEALVWTFPDNAGNSFWTMDRSGKAWKGTSDLPADIKASSPPAEVDLTSLTTIYQDDILTWREKAAGLVEITFAEGLAQPSALIPEISDGTFTFLKLTDIGTKNTLVGGAPGVFWSTEAGVIQYNMANAALVRIHASLADESISIANNTRFLLKEDSDQLFLKSNDSEAGYAEETGLWVGLGADSPSAFAEEDLLGKSSILSWRRDSEGKVSVELLGAKGSTPGTFIGEKGKPLFDEVLTFAFNEVEEEAFLLTGTNAGVVRYEQEKFAYRDLSFEAFKEPVSQLASIPASGDKPPVLVSRSGSGLPFQWSRDAGWTPGNETLVAENFAESYRVHRDSRWDWGQYPQGLTCTLLNTNGPPLALGESAITGLPPIFAGERLAVDHVSSVAVAPNGDILASSPLGILRFSIDPAQEKVLGEMIDVWAGDPETRNRLPLFNRIKGNGREMLAWNDEVTLVESTPNGRVWSPYLSEKGEAVAHGNQILEEFTYTQGSDKWKFSASSSRESSSDREMSVSHNESKPWLLPLNTVAPRDFVATNKGLWILNENQLYLVNRRRLVTHPLYWLDR